MKIICHRISIQTLLFHACLPTRQNGVENRDNAYCIFFIGRYLMLSSYQISFNMTYLNDGVVCIVKKLRKG